MPAATTTSELLDQGVEIFEYQPTMMHTKAMMVDGVVQRDRLGQLRQPLVRVERRADGRRVRPGAGRRPDQRISRPTCKASTQLDAATWKDQRSIRSARSRSGSGVSSARSSEPGSGLDLILDERRERLERLLRQAARPPAIQRDALAHREVALERRRSARAPAPSSQHAHVVLFVVRERSVVEVGGADRRPQAVDDHDLVVHHRAVVFEHLDAGLRAARRRGARCSGA